MNFNDIDINVSCITTDMGRSNFWINVPGVTEEIAKMLNRIGYGAITSKGSFEDYLNSLQTGYAYKVIQTKYDKGDFIEEFIVIAVGEKTLENNKPKMK